ncbi:MAG: nascent polypeptide-associated complex protein [Promethearchaeota archaeon]
MRRRMQQMGIEVETLEATEVIIRLADKEIVVTSPEVSVINQGGVKLFNVQGATEERPLGASGEASEAPGEEWDADAGDAETPVVELPVLGPGSRLVVEIKPEDVQLVAANAGCSTEEAERALREAGGDLARAILSLKGGEPPT